MNCNSRLSQIGSGGALETVQLTAGGLYSSCGGQWKPTMIPITHILSKLFYRWSAKQAAPLINSRISDTQQLDSLVLHWNPPAVSCTVSKAPPEPICVNLLLEFFSTLIFTCLRVPTPQLLIWVHLFFASLKKSLLQFQLCAIIRCW